MRNELRIRGILATAASVGILAVVAYAASSVTASNPSSTTTGTGTDKKTEFKFDYDVTLEDGDKIKDLHIYPPVDDPPTNPPTKKLPKLKTSETPTVGGKKFSHTKQDSDDGAVHMYLYDSAGVTEDGSVSVMFQGGSDTTSGARIVFTKNGGFTYGTGDIIGDTIVFTSNVPTVTMRLNNDAPLTAHLGQTIPVPLATDAIYSGMSYQVYSAHTRNDDRSDLLGTGVNGDTDPVPLLWNLTFSNFSGFMGPGGSPVDSPSITVPNNPALVGQSFYLVFSLREGGEDWVLGAPVQVNIVF